MEVTSIFTLFLVVLIGAFSPVVRGGVPDPPPRFPCDCIETINTPCENGRGICWYHPYPSVEYLICRANCGDPPAVDNAEIIGDVKFVDKLEGSSLTYQCTGDAIEVEHGVNEIFCPYSGVWTSSSFECTYPCCVPTAPPNAYLPYPESSYVDGDKVKFECNTGYSSAVCPTATCEAGNWTYSGDPCVEVCNDGWEGFDGSCYLFAVDIKLNWTDAYAFCEARNAILAHVETKEEADWIAARLLSFNLFMSFWTGLNDNEVEGQYVWSDTNQPYNTDIDNWAPTEPNDNTAHNENCISFFRIYGYKWNDSKCNKLFGPVCQRGMSTD